MVRRAVKSKEARLTDQWQFYNAALAGNPQPITGDMPPQSGFYRSRYKDRETGAISWEACAIWRDDNGALFCSRTIGKDLTEESEILRLWMFCAKYPVSYDDYIAVTEGKPWPFEIPESDNAPSIGDNSGDLTPFDLIRDEISNANQAARSWLRSLSNGLETKDHADKAQNFVERLKGLATKAEAQRKEEKAPHLEACTAVDTKWNPLRQSALLECAPLETARDKWLAADRKQREEAARKIEEISGLAPGTVTLEKTMVGTGSRRKSATSKQVLDVVDHAKYVEHFKNDPRVWQNYDVLNLLSRLAFADLKEGKAVAGAQLKKI
jgi:hypothetical protein